MNKQSNKRVLPNTMGARAGVPATGALFGEGPATPSGLSDLFSPSVLAALRQTLPNVQQPPDLLSLLLQTSAQAEPPLSQPLAHIQPHLLVLTPSTPAKPAPPRKKKAKGSKGGSGASEAEQDLDDEYAPSTGPSSSGAAKGKRVRTAASEPRLRWTDEETELLYLLDETIEAAFQSTNTARSQAGDAPLPLPSDSLRMAALTEKLNMPGKKGTFMTKYKAKTVKKLPRPDPEYVDLSAEYLSAVEAAAEKLLGDMIRVDAVGVVPPRMRAGGGAAGPDTTIPSATLEGGKLCPGKEGPGQHPAKALSQLPSSMGIRTLAEAKTKKVSSHRMQADAINALHGRHHFGTWYEVTQQVAGWGKKKCFVCEKTRQLCAGCMYSLDIASVAYYDQAQHKRVDENKTVVKFMCKGCASDM